MKLSHSIILIISFLIYCDNAKPTSPIVNKTRIEGYWHVDSSRSDLWQYLDDSLMYESHSFGVHKDAYIHINDSIFDRYSIDANCHSRITFSYNLSGDTIVSDGIACYNTPDSADFTRIYCTNNVLHLTVYERKPVYGAYYVRIREYYAIPYTGSFPPDIIPKALCKDNAFHQVSISKLPWFLP